MANYEATKYDFSGASLTAIQGVNTGIIIPWSSASVPSGFLECEGSAVSRSTYAALFAVVGTTYGIGDGSTTFNLPDLIDKTIVNKSPTKAFASSDGSNTVAAGGTVSVSLSPTTLSVSQIASHTHGGAIQNGRPLSPDNDAPSGTSPTRTVGISMGSQGGGGAHAHGSSGATFSGDASSVLQPYLTVMYIIKT